MDPLQFIDAAILKLKHASVGCIALDRARQQFTQFGNNPTKDLMAAIRSLGGRSEVARANGRNRDSTTMRAACIEIRKALDEFRD